MGRHRAPPVAGEEPPRRWVVRGAAAVLTLAGLTVVFILNPVVAAVGAFATWAVATLFAFSVDPADRSAWQELLVWIDEHTDY